MRHIGMRIIGGVRSHFVTRLPEWLLAAEMLAEGAQLVRTGDTFASTHAYSLLAAMVSEGPWGWAGVAIAGAWLTALFLNGTFIAFRRISPWARTLSAMVAAGYWGIWTVAMGLANPVGTGVINHAGFAALALAYSILVAGEVGAADKRAERWRQKRPKLG